MKWLVLVATLASCTSSAPDSDPFEIGELSLRVPARWVSRNLSTPTRTMHEWTPIDNERKESLAVLRVDMPGVPGKVERMERLLREAQGSLAKASFSEPTRFVTANGFLGVRVDGTFVPPRQYRTYHRVHAVVADRAALVHVIYTAAEAEPETVDIVLDNLSRKGT